MAKGQDETHVAVPFIVLFMSVFDSEEEARELLRIATAFLQSKGLDLLNAEVCKSENGGGKHFSLRVAWKGRNFGVTQIMHSGFQLTYHDDPYVSVAPEKEPHGRAIHGCNFFPQWRVRVPLRLVPIELCS